MHNDSDRLRQVARVAQDSGDWVIVETSTCPPMIGLPRIEPDGLILGCIRLVGGQPVRPSVGIPWSAMKNLRRLPARG